MFCCAGAAAVTVHALAVLLVSRSLNDECLHAFAFSLFEQSIVTVRCLLEAGLSDLTQSDATRLDCQSVRYKLVSPAQSGSLKTFHSGRVVLL
jgi:hypothetical protein